MTKQRGILTGICLIIFAALTYFIVVGQGDPDTIETGFDTAIRQWFYSIRAPWLTEVVKAITFMGNTSTIIVLCVVFLVIPKLTKRYGLPIAAVAIVGSAINKAIKHIVMRPRPDVSLHLIEQGGWSFPSGHSISGLLMYGLLAWLIWHYANTASYGAVGDGAFANGSPGGDLVFANKELARRKLFANIAVVVLTLLWISIGLSRIYLGVHYPTDVLGGWTLGMVILMITITVVERKTISSRDIR